MCLGIFGFTRYQRTRGSDGTLGAFFLLVLPLELLSPVFHVQPAADIVGIADGQPFEVLIGLLVADAAVVEDIAMHTGESGTEAEVCGHEIHVRAEARGGIALFVLLFGHRHRQDGLHRFDESLRLRMNPLKLFLNARGGAQQQRVEDFRLQIELRCRTLRHGGGDGQQGGEENAEFHAASVSGLPPGDKKGKKGCVAAGTGCALDFRPSPCPSTSLSAMSPRINTTGLSR